MTLSPAPGSGDGSAAAHEMQHPNHRDLTAGSPAGHQVLLARLVQQKPGEDFARTGEGFASEDLQ